jgi:hypothetical protein
METEKNADNAKKYNCGICDFECYKKSNYNSHLLTRKHKKRANGNQMETMETDLDLKNAQKEQKMPDVFECEFCSRIYKQRSGLWKHNKKCNVYISLKDEEIKHELKGNDNEVICKLINQNMELVTQNQEFKQMMIEQNKQNADLQKQLLDLAKETKITTINNTNNNKFNMNIFLNEKCKDALNIMDFVNSLQLQLQDLEKTAELGYVNGISRIFINGLKQLDVCKRPIHCSDAKRETLYVKDNDTWEKEDTDKKKITRAIRHVSIRNAKQVGEWAKENKGYNDSSSKKSDKYLKIVSEANGGEPEELNKIIKNISTNVIIDKNEI